MLPAPPADLNGILRAGGAGTGAADSRLRVTLGTTVAVEGWSQADSGFAGDSSGNRINFLETR